MSDEMIDRARRIVDDERNQTHLGKWAEALLAERAKREEADRQRALAQTRAGNLSTELVLMETRVADLEAALRKYGWHLPSCEWTRGSAPGRGKRPCTCGFDALLAGGSDES